MSRLTESIERALAARAGLYLAVLEDEEAGLVLSGMVASEELREAALDIARALAGPVALVDDITVTDAIPDEIADVSASARSERGIARLQRAPVGAAVEPGDFSMQHFVGSADEASGPERSLEDDEVGAGDEVFVPPVDPPTDEDEVLGGLEFSSMDDVSVDQSADSALGDEAVRDAVLRELREDTATTALALDVEVTEGVVRLTGRVPDLDDAESAEEVATRVPGVIEVDEDLVVTALESGDAKRGV